MWASPGLAPCLPGSSAASSPPPFVPQSRGKDGGWAPLQGVPCSSPLLHQPGFWGLSPGFGGSGGSPPKFPRRCWHAAGQCTLHKPCGSCVQLACGICSHTPQYIYLFFVCESQRTAFSWRKEPVLATLCMPREGKGFPSSTRAVTQEEGGSAPPTRSSPCFVGTAAAFVAPLLRRCSACKRSHPGLAEDAEPQTKMRTARTTTDNRSPVDCKLH